MANPYFQFKQFTVHQGPGMLKVSTDSCIFGAWAAEMSRELGVGSPESMAAKAESRLSTPDSGLPTPDSRLLTPDSWLPTPDSRLLDIGAGTGLLMLMLAQQWKGPVDGIEIDNNAFEQALANIKASPWAERLRLMHGDIKSFMLPAAYDLIISNPPFYEGDLTSPVAHKNLAKHDAGMTLDALLEAVERCAVPRARLATLLPFHRGEYFTTAAAAYGWRVSRQLLVKQTPAHSYFRWMLWMEKGYDGAMATEEMTIHTANGKYSERMIELLKPYYLYLKK